MRLRSLLFAPADAPRKVEKAVASGADAVILDLEDSVAPAAKAAARTEAAAALRARPGTLIVRINPRGTAPYLDDLAAIVPAHPAAILLPKCTAPADLLMLSGQIDVLEAASGVPAGAVGVLLLATETADSLKDMDYAGVSPRLRALCFGAEDLSADLGITPRRSDGSLAAPVAAARDRLLIAAAAAGVAAIDTPFPDPRDPAGLQAETAAAAADGFSGKLCIHPGQLEAVTAAFTPSPERVAWAHEVVRLLDGSGAGVAVLDGRMIDIAHLKLARRVLATAPDEAGDRS
ncbi:HpcH/HpaI aldolase/citrate lyase family protein [Methylobacterium nonmethylotrophicum]|uniref:CoA ester lyase n=1 Tax=Methylobacterium nonmethylotrophicum TaxID=1141884 RepID=A0A4Z0NY46_9HYPH|nr:CoA ester lyase [Methylobacterium nonmethylotrophicum]TGE01646.1 CoA ester lyase [Methylobacterium nonmethylotrophicum]